MSLPAIHFGLWDGTSAKQGGVFTFSDIKTQDSNTLSPTCRMWGGQDLLPLYRSLYLNFRKLCFTLSTIPCLYLVWVDWVLVLHHEPHLCQKFKGLERKACRLTLTLTHWLEYFNSASVKLYPHPRSTQGTHKQNILPLKGEECPPFPQSIPPIVSRLTYRMYFQPQASGRPVTPFPTIYSRPDNYCRKGGH